MAKHPNEWYTDGLRRQVPEVIRGIFEEFLPQVDVFVRNNSGTREDAKDVFMYGVEVVYRKVQSGELKLSAGFFTYLFEVCKRHWLKSLRRKKFDAGVTPDDPAVSNVATIEPENALSEHTERRRLLAEKFAKLQEDCRMVLSLSWHTDLSMEQIAETMNWTYAYARKRKHQCKEYLIAAVKSDHRYSELSAG